jgi:hypothetical protein
MTAARSFLSQAEPNTTVWCLPDAGSMGRPGQAGQRLGVGEPGPAVADLGQQGGGAHPARAGQGGEDGGVGMGAKPLHDLALELLDLGPDGVQGRDQPEGHHGPGFALWAGQPGRASARRPSSSAAALRPG